jgi:negative regulator of flagellin synthesis FlgM
MRIDAAVPLPENVQAQKATRSGSSSQQTSPAPVGSGQDQAQLSINSGTVQRLQANLGQLPDVRQEKVSALRQAVASGSYQISDQQLSDAIGSELLR